ncbi:hypothetical protein [Actinomadura atramentaria]|uniref:hypothetical protein n=1 Tax=Actinomadura atramentaria TaxID=1990 RepID=UPI0012FB3204|nr:hypothetical protein [Actinomadura atramentaria]
MNNTAETEADITALEAKIITAWREYKAAGEAEDQALARFSALLKLGQDVLVVHALAGRLGAVHQTLFDMRDRVKGTQLDWLKAAKLSADDALELLKDESALSDAAAAAWGDWRAAIEARAESKQRVVQFLQEAQGKVALRPLGRKLGVSHVRLTQLRKGES